MCIRFAFHFETDTLVYYVFFYMFLYISTCAVYKQYVMRIDNIVHGAIDYAYINIYFTENKVLLN